MKVLKKGKTCGCGVELTHDDYKYSGCCPVCGTAIGTVRKKQTNPTNFAELLTPALHSIFRDQYQHQPALYNQLFNVPLGRRPGRRTATEALALARTAENLGITLTMRDAFRDAVASTTNDLREAILRVLQEAERLSAPPALIERLTNLLNTYDDLHRQQPPPPGATGTIAAPGIGASTGTRVPVDLTTTVSTNPYSGVVQGPTRTYQRTTVSREYLVGSGQLSRGTIEARRGMSIRLPDGTQGTLDRELGGLRYVVLIETTAGARGAMTGAQTVERARSRLRERARRRQQPDTILTPSHLEDAARYIMGDNEVRGNSQATHNEQTN